MSGPSYDFTNDPLGVAAVRVAAGVMPLAMMRGAENLLVKAAAAWSDQDDAKAARLIDRAAALPFDRREEVWPGPQAACSLLFELLTHTVETSAPREWFAAVEATFLGLDEAHRQTACDALGPVLHDWDLDPELEHQVRALVAGRPADDTRWMRADIDARTLREGTESALRVAVRLSEELDSRGLCAHLVPEYW